MIMEQRKNLYDTIPGLRDTHRDSNPLPAIPDPHPSSAATAREIFSRAIGPVPGEEMRMHMDEEMLFTALELDDRERKLVAKFEADLDAIFKPVMRR
jgi:hypothetical protein